MLVQAAAALGFGVGTQTTGSTRNAKTHFDSAPVHLRLVNPKNTKYLTMKKRIVSFAPGAVWPCRDLCFRFCLFLRYRSLGLIIFKIQTHCTALRSSQGSWIICELVQNLARCSPVILPQVLRLCISIIKYPRESLSALITWYLKIMTGEKKKRFLCLRQDGECEL